MRNLKLYLFILIFASFDAYGQISSTRNISGDRFYFDAVVFRDAEMNLGRVDVYTVLPYENLNFEKDGAVFRAAYDIIIDIADEAGINITTSKKERVLNETDYYITQGGTAAFDFTQTIFTLPAGKYRVSVIIIDKFNNTEYEKSRVVTVLDFDSFDFSLSGLLLVSSIEEIGGKYKITPHVSDHIGNLDDGFFVFFETYNQIESRAEVDFVWEVLDANQKKMIYSDPIRRQIQTGASRHFIKIPQIEELVSGTYTFRLIAMNALDSAVFSEENYLAVTQRSINYTQSVAGTVLSDLNLAIRQLRYVAYQNELQYINSGETEAERQKRFTQFWKERDPSPGTERNEAFDEYYNRINFANNTFKSYTEGWMTDMGMVYIIFGPPMSADRQSGYGDNKNYERWLYGNNRDFLFVDNSGFGDFRLVRPMSVSEKYRYQR
ncbi:MAG: GWxTD domain-containing protein [Candidatus Kapabacteria bacterium]|nr:GWxTD domain-containing protein [Candidatus Kapabacteria bacterium]